MKKIVLNISDTTYEKLCFEAIEEKKSITELLVERIFYKPFHEDVEKHFENWIEKEVMRIIDG